MPRLLLQPLLENAVLHGISRLPQGGCIDIGVAADKDNLHLIVGNPSPPPKDHTSGGARHATTSIGHRLAFAFGPRARMTSMWHEGYYRCELAIPIQGERSARGRRQP
jgi:two-component system sensor histidine kinase AlgZ